MATPISHMMILTRIVYAITALILLSVTSEVNAKLMGGFMGPQNAARVQLGLKPLVWDDRLASYAQWWANQRRSDCALVHSGGPYGENIFWGSDASWSPIQASLGWLSEAKYYNHYANVCAAGEMCGHYTQIVWRSTRRIGCARVVCSGGAGVFMICSYDPAGNYINEKPY